MCLVARRFAATALCLAVALAEGPAGARAQPGPAGSEVAPAGTGQGACADSAAATTGVRQRQPAPRRARGRIALGAALATGGGALGWWSARRADRAYAGYLHAAGPQRQDRHLRRCRRYDRVAGAGYTAMELGLVLTARWVFY